MATVALLVLAACAPTRAASPPVPELVGPQPAPNSDTEPGEAGRTEPDDDPTAADGRAVSALSDEPGGAGAVGDWAAVPGAAEASGWSAFERSIERALLGGGAQAAGVAVAVDGLVVRAVSFGDRIAGDPERPATAESRFRIASISKLVTAIVVMQLVEEGSVALDEPVGGLLAEHLGVEPVDARVRSITVEQLLGHTSGFGVAATSFFGQRGLTCQQIAAEALRGRLESSPGGAVRYSNTNSCVAGILVEALTGADYALEVYRRLLTPLGISGMRLAGTYDLGPDEVLHPSFPGRNYMEALGPAGGWIASATDIVRIVDSINPSTPGWSPLEPASIERMRRPPFGPGTGGLGLGLLVYPDGSFGHTGTLENTRAMALARPDGVTWVVLVSGEHPGESVRLRDHLDRALRDGFPDG